MTGLLICAFVMAVFLYIVGPWKDPAIERLKASRPLPPKESAE